MNLQEVGFGGMEWIVVSPPKPSTRLSSPPYALHGPPILFYSILSPKQNPQESKELSNSKRLFLAAMTMQFRIRQGDDNEL